MIAQLYEISENTAFTMILKQLLKNLGDKYPESVLFSLNFAIRCKIKERIKPAQEIVKFIA